MLLKIAVFRQQTPYAIKKSPPITWHSGADHHEFLWQVSGSADRDEQFTDILLDYVAFWHIDEYGGLCGGRKLNRMEGRRMIIIG